MNPEFHSRIGPFGLVLGALALAAALIIGCEKREKVFELESPAVDVEVERSDDGVQVDVNRDGENKDEPQ